MSHNLEAALALAAAGLPVLPCRCSDDKALDKKPLVSRHRMASTHRTCIEGWWRRFGSETMPGIRLESTGLVVIDLDRHEGAPDGVAAFDALCDQYGDVPECPVTETPSRGFHLAFRQPEGRSLGLREGALQGKGINVRGVGGYVIAPGAVRSDGTYYGAVAGTPDLCEAFKACTIPVIPDWFVELIEAGRYVPSAPVREWVPLRHDNPRRNRAWALSGLDRYAYEVASTMRGGRNNILNKHTYTMAGYVDCGVTEGETWDAISWACEMNGMIADDGADAFRNTFYSAWPAGIKKGQLPGPRDPPAVDIVISLKPKEGNR
jgi:hypothetical protein